jgi:hypothetical protein
MTDWKKWFEYYEVYPMATIGVPCSPVEEMYQAFKARLKTEAALNVWPED